MHRGGQEGGLHGGDSAARLDKRHAVVPMNLVRDSDFFVELDQVRAYAKQNVLAIIHDLARPWMLVGRSAASEEWTFFKECHSEAEIRERARCCQPGQTASGDRNFWLGRNRSHQIEDRGRTPIRSGA